MAGINKAIILGNLGRDPEIIHTTSGIVVCKFSIATSKKTKDGQEITQWHRCTAFGKVGEIISKYVSKGDQLYVEGEINYSQYEKDRITHYSTDIIVREFNFINSGNKHKDSNSNKTDSNDQFNQTGSNYHSNNQQIGGHKRPSIYNSPAFPDDKFDDPPF